MSWTNTLFSLYPKTESTEKKALTKIKYLKKIDSYITPIIQGILSYYITLSYY